MLSTRPAPVAAPQIESGSLFCLLAFGALLGLLLLAPQTLSGFWPTTHDFWPQAIWLLLSAGATLLLALSPSARPRFDLTASVLLAFLGWNALSLLTASYRHDAYLEMARLFGAFLPFFALRALWGEGRAMGVAFAWILGMSWSCWPALADFAQTHYPRQAGPFFNTNLFANALAMTLPLALIAPFLVARLTSHRVLRALAVSPFLICAFGLVVTSSKGGFLAALIGLGVAGALILRAKSTQVRVFVRRYRAILALASLFFLLVFGALAAKTIVPRLQSARGSDDNSTMFRVYVWRSTLDMARAKPLLGFGPGAFPHVYPRFARVGYTGSAHQSWLQVAAEGGFPALILLLAAIAVALKAGFARLKTRDWPLVAGASGAVAALLVHGCVDAGFQTPSVVIFLATALAILTAQAPTDGAAPSAQVETSPGAASPNAATSRLNPLWIGATLLLALGGNATQKAASGENAHLDAERFWKNGAPLVALQKAREAVGLDPGSARLWSAVGQLQAASGQPGDAALQTAAQLQPTRAANWANLASVAAPSHPAEAERLYARALAQDPLNTHLRLERARFRLESKNSAGNADLEAILALKTRPYGRYEPVEQNVNLDFARATLLLAPELQRRGQAARLQTLVKSALADCARAQSFAAQNEQMRRESGGEFGEAINPDLETLTAALKALST